ncbi:MAG: ABC transporter ATP-binding protein [Myxococcales bacterium]
MARIRIKNLRKVFGAAAALQGIDLTIENGELVAILGPSGCGKTTTLQLLAGFAVPDGGEIWSDDRLISSAGNVVVPEQRRMSLVFQSYALWPHLTVFKNVAFGLETRGLPADEIRRRVGAILEVVNLGGFAERYPHELSGGQQQRVALARALVVEPDTLLLDEPLSNLDASLREQMRFEIRRVHEATGITTVYVTHDQSEALVIADRIAVMNKGRVEQIGTPKEVFERPASRFVASFIGGASCLPGSVVGPGRVQCGPFQFRAGEGQDFRAGDAVMLCVRPHSVRVHQMGAGPGPAEENMARGRLVQLAYLGDMQDVRIALEGGEQIRALTRSGQTYQNGDQVLVELPMSGCRLLPS